VALSPAHATRRAHDAEDAFRVEPYSAKELRFHVAGAALNAAVVVASLAWVIATWERHAIAWWGVLLALLAGAFVADLVSGLLHWAFDTWFNENIPFVRRMVLQVREHHIYPQRIFDIHFTHDAGTLSWISLIFAAPVAAWTIFDADSALPVYAVLALGSFSPLLVFMLETHKCGHRSRNPLAVRLLQKSGVLLSPSHHMRHHCGNHDVNYCIVNGWADRTLGRLGLFRGLEWVVERTTGARPQRDDHEWLRRFGRQVHPRQAQPERARQLRQRGT